MRFPSAIMITLAATPLALASCATNRALDSGTTLADWPEMRGDTTRSGASRAERIEPPLYLAWREKVGRSPVDEPALAGQVMLLPGSDRTLRLVETETGDRVWKRKLDGVPSTNAVVAGERAFVGHLVPVARLSAVSVRDGSELWHTNELRPTGGMLVRGDTLFVWDIGKGPVAVNVESGEIHWRSEIGGRWPSPLAHTRGILVAACERDSVFALSSASGRRVWSAAAPGGARGAPAIASELVVLPGAGGVVRALDARSGEQMWSRTLPSRVTSAACVVDGVAYVGALNARLYAIGLFNGEALWNVELDGVCHASPALSRGALVIGTMSGTCQIVSISERRVVYTVDLDRPVRVSPVVRGDRLYCADDGGNVYAYESS